jgi:hypothetical protein
MPTILILSLGIILLMGVQFGHHSAYGGDRVQLEYHSA